MKLTPYFLRTTYWMKDYFKGNPIRSHYNDIRTIMENPVIGVERKKEYLDNLLKHTTHHSIFYGQYQLKELQAFPVVNKFILAENHEQIKIAYDKIPNQIGDLSIQITSGSTGTPFSLPLDTLKNRRRIAELKYFGEKAGFKSHDKLVHLRTWNKWQNKTKLQAIRENIIPFGITNMDDERLRELCTIIRKNKVASLRGYASSIDLLVRYSIKNNINLPSLKIIFSVSESLQDATRELVENHIGCNIISQYANQENGILAQEEVLKGEKNAFFLNQASYVFEILKLDEDKPASYGELGRIVITDLFNYAFPMIRYDTGDTGIMVKNGQHKNEYPVIAKLYGRRIDLVFDTKGDVVYPMAVAMLMKHYPEIIQWQFIQSGKISYLLRLSVKHKQLKSDEIKKGLLKLFGEDAKIEFKFTDDIPVLASGKRKSVVNNWKK